MPLCVSARIQLVREYKSKARILVRGKVRYFHSEFNMIRSAHCAFGLNMNIDFDYLMKVLTSVTPKNRTTGRLTA